MTAALPEPTPDPGREGWLNTHRPAQRRRPGRRRAPGRPAVEARLKGDERFAWFREIEDHVQRCVYASVDVDPEAPSERVKMALAIADKMVRNAEKRFFREIHPDWRDAVPTPEKLRGVLGNMYSAEWPPERAKRRFLEVARAISEPRAGGKRKPPTEDVVI